MYLIGVHILHSIVLYNVSNVFMPIELHSIIHMYVCMYLHLTIVILIH